MKNALPIIGIFFFFGCSPYKSTVSKQGTGIEVPSIQEQRQPAQNFPEQSQEQLPENGTKTNCASVIPLANVISGTWENKISSAGITGNIGWKYLHIPKGNMLSARFSAADAVGYTGSIIPEAGSVGMGHKFASISICEGEILAANDVCSGDGVHGKALRWAVKGYEPTGVDLKRVCILDPGKTYYLNLIAKENWTLDSGWGTCGTNTSYCTEGELCSKVCSMQFSSRIWSSN